MCKDCLAGKFGDAEGQVNVILCKDCLVGKNQMELGQASCDECEPGYYQNEKAKTYCLPCIRKFVQQL
jgi:hypothetical protein